MIDDDDGDRLIDDERAELEARFRQLELQAEVSRLRRQQGRPPVAERGDPAGGSPVTGDDPLAEMKQAFDHERAHERHLLVICPGCGAKNRTRLSKLRLADPVCGACGRSLAS